MGHAIGKITEAAFLVASARWIPASGPAAPRSPAPALGPMPGGGWQKRPSFLPSKRENEPRNTFFFFFLGGGSKTCFFLLLFLGEGGDWKMGGLQQVAGGQLCMRRQMNRNSGKGRNNKICFLVEAGWPSSFGGGGGGGLRFLRVLKRFLASVVLCFVQVLLRRAIFFCRDDFLLAFFPVVGVHVSRGPVVDGPVSRPAVGLLKSFEALVTRAPWENPKGRG